MATGAAAGPPGLLSAEDARILSDGDEENVQEMQMTIKKLNVKLEELEKSFAEQYCKSEFAEHILKTTF